MKNLMNKIDFLLIENRTHKDIQTKIEVGDYLICDEPVYYKDRKLSKFLKNNVGVCVEIQPKRQYPYLISYSNIPENLHKYFSLGYKHDNKEFSREDIINFSSKPENKYLTIGYNYNCRHFSKENIIKHMTPEEYKEYKFNQIVHKYNL